MKTSSPQSVQKELALKRLASGLTPAVAEPLGDNVARGAMYGDDPGVRFTPAEPDDWFAEISHEFDPPTWLATDCVQADEGGELHLIASLRQPMSPALVLATHREGVPFAIIAPGRLAQPSTLWLMLQEYVTRQRMHRFGGVLLLTMTFEQTVMLRRLGLPAAPIDDLTLDLQDIEALEQRLSNLQSINPSAIDKTHPKRPSTENAFPKPAPKAVPLPGDQALLVVPGFDPVTFSRTPLDHGRPLVERLEGLEDRDDADLGGVGVWLPSDASIARIQRAAVSTSESSLPKAFLASLRGDMYAAEQVFAPDQSLLSGNVSSADFAHRWQSTDPVVVADEQSRQLQAKLQQAGQASGDHVEQILYSNLAQLQSLAREVRRTDSPQSLDAQLRVLDQTLKTASVLDRRTSPKRKGLLL
jgi:hypothetical protein